MNFFNNVKDSVVDFDFYRSIKGNKFGRSFTYLLILFMLVYSMQVTKLYVGISSGINDLANGLSTEVPDFELKEGEFHFYGEMPYYIGGNEANAPYVIDTTGQTDAGILQGKFSGILITRTQMIVKQATGAVQTLNFRDFGEVNLTKQDIVRGIPKIAPIALAVMIFAFVFVFGWKLLNALILALLGLIADSIFKTRLKFSEVYNMSIYALTLPILIQLALFLAGVSIPGFFLIYWTISIVYIFMGIRACKKDEEPDGVDVV